LFCSESLISQPLTSEHFYDINTPRSDEEDELDLPSLESLLRRTPVPPSSKSDRELGYGEPTESTIQIQRWKKIVGPDNTPILEELPEHELETPAPRINDTEKEQWLITGRAPGKPMSVPHNRLIPKVSSRVTAKRLSLCPLPPAQKPMSSASAQEPPAPTSVPTPASEPRRSKRTLSIPGHYAVLAGRSPRKPCRGRNV
jgi:hypothetical protein